MSSIYATVRRAASPAVRPHRTIVSSAIVTAISAVSMGLASPALADYKEVIVFGDDLSDIGNMASLCPEFGEYASSRPYNENRLSNDRLFVEHLVNKLSIGTDLKASLEDGTNYAVAGARAGNFGFSPRQRDEQITECQTIDIKKYRIEEQIRSYVETTAVTDDTLIVIAIGTNDVFDTMGMTDETYKKRLGLATEAVATGVEELMGKNARRFVVIDVPMIDNLPEIRDQIAAAEAEQEGDGEVVKAKARSRSTYYNESLAEELNGSVAVYNNTATENEKVVLKIVQLSSISDDVANKVEGLVFKNHEDACMENEDGGERSYHEDCGSEDAKINTFAYVDKRRPTNDYHSKIAEKVNEVVPAAPGVVPPPPPENKCPPDCRVIDPDKPLFHKAAAARMIRENPNPWASQPNANEESTAPPPNDSSASPDIKFTPAAESAGSER